MEFEKYGYFRGNEKINSEFSKIQWEKEIKKIFENQKFLPNEFIDDYLGDGKNNKGIFNRLREFSDGPGSEKSPTKYGLYREVNGKVEKVAENLWDLLIGKCSVFPELNRANKKSCSSEISNILNQLNTIAVNDSNRDDSLLSEKEKKEIIFKIVSTSKNPLLIIKEVCKLENTNNISKYPTKESKTNKSTENQNLEKLDNTKILFSVLGSKYSINNYDDLIKNKDFFNDLIDVFARFPKQYEAIQKELSKKINDDSLVEDLVLKSDKISSQSTSSMSYKALDLYIKEEIVDKGKTLNQKYKSKIDENETNKFKFDFEKSKYINEDCLDDQEFVLSPTTKCSFRETLKVFNKILKRYIYNPSNHTKQTYHLKNIVMEMPTEWNTKDERDLLTKIKNANEERKEKAKKNYGYEGEDKTIINKLNLLFSQNKKDVYTGQILDPELVISDPNYTEIDHIIPYSISYDDSWNNKVLVHRTSNQEKKNRTPREYLGNKFFGFKKMWEEMFLTEGEFYNKNKFENLCMDVKSDDYRRRAGFIGRNLADTRYACRIGKQALEAWISGAIIKNNLSDDEINIITVNGKYTQRYRSEKFLNLKKDRDEDYSHHAIDATICAILGNSKEDVGKLV
ncbi:MAG: type II CRISPR RNA-guided endonuclease Cas9, partial [Malacoplasma sp.]|nr:type II CRISPR RNA-guided endonuclease Cas9 [Malacoplasma sp.]